MLSLMIPLMIVGGFDGVEALCASAPLREETTAESGVVIKSRLTYTGITSAARRFGCSREHLSKVLHGQRKPNDSLKRRLARLGISQTVDGKEL